ncbi:hypothetical protein BDF19DRAFT_312659 [Syncephalis fuscata]|nr:hypothetical protein BDF19DRAFT_312659 [Syncephalis fuscata]
MAAHSNKEKGQAVYSTLSVFGLPANLHSCGICYEPFITNAATTSASTAPNHGQYLACLHSYCDPCLSTYVSTKLQGNVNPFPLHCPEPECLFEVADKHIKSILSNKDYDLWIRKKAESDMCGKMYCPNKRCSELLTVANLSKADNCLAACTSCYHAICVRCKRLWHNGYSCKEYSQLSTKERLADDYDVLVMAQSNKWRRCTKCKTLVELKYGCNHITCHCGHQL